MIVRGDFIGILAANRAAGLSGITTVRQQSGVRALIQASSPKSLLQAEAFQDRWCSRFERCPSRTYNRQAPSWKNEPSTLLNMVATAIPVRSPSTLESAAAAGLRRRSRQGRRLDPQRAEKLLWRLAWAGGGSNWCFARASPLLPTPLKNRGLGARHDG